MFLNLEGLGFKTWFFGSCGEAVRMWFLLLSSIPKCLFGRRAKGMEWREICI